MHQPLSSQPAQTKSVVHRPYPKLSFKYFCPLILTQIWTVAYKLHVSPAVEDLHFVELSSPIQLNIAGLGPEPILRHALSQTCQCCLFEGAD
jgi:hypothetical protein